MRGCCRSCLQEKLWERPGVLLCWILGAAVPTEASESQHSFVAGCRVGEEAGTAPFPREAWLWRILCAVPQTSGTCREPALSSPCSPWPYGEKERGLWLPPGSYTQVCLLEHVCLFSPPLESSSGSRKSSRSSCCSPQTSQVWSDSRESPGPIPGGSGSTGSGCFLPLGISAWERFQALPGCRCGPEESQISDLQPEEQLPPAGRNLLTGLSKTKTGVFYGQK